MIIGGLVSITFRKLSVMEVLELVKKSDVSAIEWGGDVHVPHGDISAAREVRAMSCDLGVEIAAYGSYYKVGESEGAGLSFASVLDSARELGTSTIRVWAGARASMEADEKYRSLVVEDTCRIADMAQKAGIAVAFEYHRNTLTDTNESAQYLLNAIKHENVLSYWQPPIDMDFEERLQGLEAILKMDKLANLHVYQWQTKGAGSLERKPLSDGTEDWSRYFHTLKKSGKKHYAMIEFVQDDSTERFLEDAKTLANLIIPNCNLKASNDCVFRLSRGGLG